MTLEQKRRLIAQPCTLNGRPALISGAMMPFARVTTLEPDKFDSEMRKALHRMALWNGGAWYYVGVICRAHIDVPIGQGSFVIYTIDSAGLWGIESDAGDYLDEAYKDQESELRTQLGTMGRAFINLEGTQ